MINSKKIISTVLTGCITLGVMASMTLSGVMADDQTAADASVTRNAIQHTAPAKSNFPLRLQLEFDTPKFTAFESYEQMKEYFLKKIKQMGSGSSDTAAEAATSAPGMDTPASPEPAAVADSAKGLANEGGSNSGEYGDTNNQVSGVNEADIIKNDGKYIYVLSQNTGSISIIDAKASDMKVLATLPLQRDNAYYTNMYLYGDKLVLLFNEYRYVQYDENYKAVDTAVSSKKMIAPIWGYSYNYTGIDIYDISDRTKPAFTRTVKTQGNCIDTREQNGVVYLITSQYSDIYRYYGLTAENLEKLPEEAYIPTYYDSLQGKDAIRIPAENVARLDGDQADNSRTYITAVSLTSDDAPVINSFVGSGWGNVYMSNNAVYIAQQEWKDDGTYTNIVKYDVDGINVGYRATGRVMGSMLNQFSADEFEDNFRVATTEWKNDGNENSVFIFDKDMKLQSALRGLAKKESIQSARFMGNTLYLVTYLRTDPLFVIDLSNTHSPKVLGELKIPGFSTYLHPVGDGLVVGIGMGSATMYYRDEDTGDEIECGTTETGVKVSLFDVSDPTNPKEISKLKVGERGSYSETLSNHKSFLHIDSRDLIGMRGNFVSSISADGINSTSKNEAVLISYADKKLTKVKAFEGDYSWDTANRMTYIDNVLYHFTGNDLVAYDMDNGYKKLGSVKYNNYVEPDYPVMPMPMPADDIIAK